ncbi:MAG: hypothetical protein GY933_00200 [Hyphomicrobiales bacterium]|nr:hypothetical protein [Hyphomicrobiales bacterium]
MATQTIGIISPRTIIVTQEGRLTNEGFAYLQSLRTQVTGDSSTSNNLDDLYTQQMLLPPTGGPDVETGEFIAMISAMAGTIEALRRRVEDLEYEVLI